MMQLTGERGRAAYLPFRNPAQIAFYKNLIFFGLKLILQIIRLFCKLISKINLKN
jgi:hypothetical protein